MLHFKKQIYITTTVAILLTVALYANQTTAFSTWADPTANPPGNNADTPINVGGTAQGKSGSLGVGVLAPIFKLDVLGGFRTKAYKPVVMESNASTTQFEWQFESDRLRFNKAVDSVSPAIGDLLSFNYSGRVGIGGAPSASAKLKVYNTLNVNNGGITVWGNSYFADKIGVGTIIPEKKIDVTVASDGDGLRIRRSDNSTGISINSGGKATWIDFVGTTESNGVSNSGITFIPKKDYNDLGTWQPIANVNAKPAFIINGLDISSYVGARKYCDIDGVFCFKASDVVQGSWKSNGADTAIYNTNSTRNVGIGTQSPLATVGGKTQTVLEVNATGAGAENPDGHAAIVIRSKAGSNPRLFLGTTQFIDPTWVLFQRNNSAGQLAIANQKYSGTIALEISDTAVPVTTINGGLKFTAGAPALNKILASDATGLASWKAVSEIPGLGGSSNWEVSPTNTNLLYNKNQASASAVVVGGNTQSVTGSKFEVNGSSVFKGILGLTGTNAVEFGKNVVGKQVDAGKIMYKRYSNGLDIIGAGEAGVARIVKIWDSLVVDTIFATNICSNTTGACNSVTNIIGGNLWIKDGTDIKLSGDPNDTVNVFNSKVNTFAVNNIDNYFKLSGTSSFTLNQGGVVRLRVGDKVSVNSNTDFHVGYTGQPGKFVYGGNSAGAGKVLVAKDSSGTAEWQNLPIIVARFIKDSGTNSNFSRSQAGGPAITYRVSQFGGIGEPSGNGGKDFLVMQCPTDYTAIAGGGACTPGNYLEDNTRNDVTQKDWTVSCGTELGKIGHASITCAKIQ